MFNAHLINDPFSDPGVYVKLKYKNEAVLFDLGELYRLPPRKLLKINHIFVSHTHMDHFIGFDHLLRVCLGRDKHISLFGPQGFIKNVEGKLASYTWNLVENYTNNFILLVTEIHKCHKITMQYRCQNAFKPEFAGDSIFDGTLVDSDDFIAKSVFLDHKIPSLAYSLTEKTHINIKKNALSETGLPAGKWLSELKDHIKRGDPDNTPVKVWWKDGDNLVVEKILRLGKLKASIVKITAGKKISYVTDAVYNNDNSQKIIELSKKSDIIFIEAPFIEADSEIAKRKYHLTAKQAGLLAKKAGAKRMCIFHFSPKYKGSGNILTDEAMKAFTA